jgi:tRNA-2-methylthio-N6-dimethylallyladenosine synthase
MINFFIKTYGCQANVADSQILADHLVRLGCNEVGRESCADLIIINTCAIRDKAEQKLWSYIGKLAEFKHTKPFLSVGIIGCVASYKKTEIYTRFDHISFVYGAREDRDVLHAYLSDVVTRIQTAKQLYDQEPTAPSLHGGQDRDVNKLVTLLRSHSDVIPAYARAAGKRIPSEEPCRSFINIMTGCNKYCSYCIVPFTRGQEISYPMNSIIATAQQNIAQSATEITLVGQNVNSYKDPETGVLFPELLRRVAECEGTFWVRFMSPHPQDMTIELFDIMAAYRPKVAASLHFPLQSGSDRILKLMNRTYTVDEYLTKIGWIRERMPDATISTDIIVGFPGETEEDFLATMAIVETVRFDLIYSFIYSPRAFTKASLMSDDCSYAVKQHRLDRLQERQTEIAAERNATNIGKTLRCLVEKRLGHGKLLARTEGNIRVIFEGTEVPLGSFVDLLIESSGPANMHGRVVSDSLIMLTEAKGGIAKW